MGDDAAHFRVAPRPKVAVVVRYRRDRAGSMLEYSGTTLDIGPRGAFIETDTPPHVGERVRLHVSSPSSWDPLEIAGEVRWVRDQPPGFGVRFADLSQKEVTALHELVSAAGYFEGDR
jgi:hypothetical protein